MTLTKELYLNIEGSQLATLLETVKSSYPDVYLRTVSYPVNNDLVEYKIQVTVQGESSGEVLAAVQLLADSVPDGGSYVQVNTEGSRGNILSTAGAGFDVFQGCSDNISAEVKHSLQVITDCIVKYGTENTAIAFNGGKDCTVLLHLVSTLINSITSSSTPITLLAVCIDGEDVFPAVTQFVQDSLALYNLKLLVYKGQIKSGLFNLHQAHPNIKAILMGTRSTDPYSSHLVPFTPCDPGWPPLVRVLPILDWKYSQVWSFLKEFNVPYCELYDRGFTSLGNIRNTKENPALQDNEGYSPAYLLEDESLERAGRV